MTMYRVQERDVVVEGGKNERHIEIWKAGEDLSMVALCAKGKWFMDAKFLEFFFEYNSSDVPPEEYTFEQLVERWPELPLRLMEK